MHQHAGFHAQFLGDSFERGADRVGVEWFELRELAQPGQARLVLGQEILWPASGS